MMELKNAIEEKDTNKIFLKSKIIVFISAIINNLNSYYEQNKNRLEIINEFENYILKKKDAVKGIFEFLYSGDDSNNMFLNKKELESSLDFFLKIKKLDNDNDKVYF